MTNEHHPSWSFISLRSCTILLCISVVIIQVSQALHDDLLSSSSLEENHEHQLYRRSSKQVAKMLELMLQRGEMQVEPYHIHRFIGRVNRRKTIDQMKNSMMNYF
ncbi:unnamed protein product [Rotaria magnacalcarata]|uniref:Uncharacterized protein n=1 Tax=Rotaria magnacalcarata TaxID=392030 RepID=A0A815QJC3_9BILA|nr:unnamed protein product [Rotaria magnacalcarata]CAF1594083.1 unnamed protein product [Rotaria magnacalcarata]CAF1988331.1 unnamed protein product [Rotaria magnacalcarata]CAF2117630.1 unnamed protein product [Rotaria magnacalcarata]CAF2175351.1 unnamed protein product [Rotaria magnacalcarata]